MKSIYLSFILLCISITVCGQVATDTLVTASPDIKINSAEITFDKAEFSKKALQKTGQFSNYVQIITGVNTTKEGAAKSIQMACDLFTSEDSRVEVSNTKSDVKNKYKVRDYLTRLQFKAGQYDKIVIEYADINYASDFKKGTDGNYYAIVTFVQKFIGFMDGNIAYGDVTKKNLTIVVKSFERVVNGSAEKGWDVFLADMGVVETRKL